MLHICNKSLGIILQTKTSSQKGNDRSPESQVSILNSSQVSKRFFFSIGKGQFTPQSMVGPFPTSIKGRNSVANLQKNDALQSQRRSYQ